MRDNRPVMTALFESAMTAGPASGALWDRLAQDTGVLREHLEYLRDQGRPLPGRSRAHRRRDGRRCCPCSPTPCSRPTRQAGHAAGPPAGTAAGPPGRAIDPQTGLPEPRYPDAEIVDSLARLLLHGLAGPAGTP